MKPNRLNQHRLRTLLVWSLLALWLAGSVQASVHTVLMSELAVQTSTTVLTDHTDMAHHTSDEHPSDAPCVELCLLISLSPVLMPLSQAGAHTTPPVGPPVVPERLEQPTVPPPRLSLL